MPLKWFAMLAWHSFYIFLFISKIFENQKHCSNFDEANSMSNLLVQVYSNSNQRLWTSVTIQFICNLFGWFPVLENMQQIKSDFPCMAFRETIPVKLLVFNNIEWTANYIFKLTDSIIKLTFKKLLESKSVAIFCFNTA